MSTRDSTLGIQSCPRCGGTTWNPLVDWRKRVGFSVAPVACARCGLTAQQIGIDAAIAADPVQDPNAQITIPLEDLEFELIEPRDQRAAVMIGARVRHTPTGISAEATSYDNRSDNQRAALQGLALQLIDRDAHLH